MTNRMIDADALLMWVKATKGLFDDETLDDFYLSTIEKINELSLDVPKQYVDVNVLKSQLLKITFPRQYGHMPYYKQIMDKIQSVIGSIATPAPEPKQSIFDADALNKLIIFCNEKIDDTREITEKSNISTNAYIAHYNAINDFKDIIDKINELATPVESQEIIGETE